MSDVYLVLPASADDPARPSGGNVYDRRLAEALANRGWRVRRLPIDGGWPAADDESERALARSLQAVPDGAPVVLDGLYGSSPAVAAASRRVRLVLLLHSGAVPADVAWRAVVVPSEWAGAQAGIDAVVAPPGVDPAEMSPAGDGRALLSVGAVTPVKGHDLLVAALARVAHLEWRCTIVGPVDRDPDFVDDLRASMGHGTLCERIRLTGARPPEGVRCAYRNADLLVLPSRSESYGMVVTEALAHGLPVVASAVGGVGEALGSTRHGRPGLLVAPGDVEALAEALRRWLTDPALRDRLRTAALDRRRTLPTWAAAAAAVERALEMVAA